MDDPWVSKQTILERMKADDLWVKADDSGQSGRSRGLKVSCLIPEISGFEENIDPHQNSFG